MWCTIPITKVMWKSYKNKKCKNEIKECSNQKFSTSKPYTIFFLFHILFSIARLQVLPWLFCRFMQHWSFRLKTCLVSDSCQCSDTNTWLHLITFIFLTMCTCQCQCCVWCLYQSQCFIMEILFALTCLIRYTWLIEAASTFSSPWGRVLDESILSLFIGGGLYLLYTLSLLLLHHSSACCSLNLLLLLPEK